MVNMKPGTSTGSAEGIQDLTERVDILEKRTRSYLWYKKKNNRQYSIYLGKNWRFCWIGCKCKKSYNRSSAKRFFSKVSLEWNKNLQYWCKWKCNNIYRRATDSHLMAVMERYLRRYLFFGGKEKEKQKAMSLFGNIFGLQIIQKKDLKHQANFILQDITKVLTARKHIQ